MSESKRPLRRIGIPLLAATTALFLPVIGLVSTASAANPPVAYLTYTSGSSGASTNVTNAGSYNNTNGFVTPPAVLADVDNGSGANGQAGFTYATVNIANGVTTPVTFNLSSSSGNVLFTQGNLNGAPGPYGSGSLAKTATCTITTGTVCNFEFVDPVSEAPTITATQVNGSLVATGSASYASLLWQVGCPANADGQNDDVSNATLSSVSDTGCVTQGVTSALQTLTVTYLQGGKPTPNVTIAVPNPPAALVGTSSEFNLTGQSTVPGFVTSQTNASGQATFSFDGTTAGTEAQVEAIPFAGYGQYPATTDAYLIDNIVASTAGSRFDNMTEQLLAPSAPAAAAQPGDVFAITGSVWADCTAPSADNNCLTPTGSWPTTAGTYPLDYGTQTQSATLNPTFLANTPVTITAPGGFVFTKCTSAVYNDCSLAGNGGTGTAVSGSQVGWLTTSGSTMKTTTNNVGQVTFYLTVQKDANLAKYGIDFGSVTVTVGSATAALSETVPGASASATTCPTIGVTDFQSAPFTPAALASGADAGVFSPIYAPGHGPVAGCASAQLVQTYSAPYNYSSPLVSAIPAKSFSTTGSTNVPDVNTEQFHVTLQDQFGNPLGNQTATGVNITSTDNGGGLYYCANSTSLTTCNGSSGPVPDTTPTNTNVEVQQSTVLVDNGFTQPFVLRAPTYNYYTATATNPDQGAVLDGAQVVNVSGSLPTDVWQPQTPNSTVLVPNTTGTAAITASNFTINWYNQLAQPIVTFKVTPKATVGIGQVITLSAKVVDQFKNPIAGDRVEFFFGGSGYNALICQEGFFAPTTNANGTAGDSITCSGNSTINATIIVTDASGNEIARGSYVLRFSGGPTVTKVYVTPPGHQAPGTITIRVTTNQPGGVVHLFDEYAGARTFVQKAISTAVPNSARNAGVVIFHISGVRATNHFYAVVNGAKSNVVTVFVK